MKKRLFFNYATVSPVSKPAYTAVKRYWDEFYEIGPPEVLYKYDPYADKLAEEVAKLLHCHADEITYTKNTTEGIVIASESLPLEKGDEILVLGEEYPANLLPWLKKREDGLTVTVLPHLHGEEGVQTLLRSIGPRTRVVTMSSAQYYDGYMADLNEVADAIHANGGYFVVDAVQSVGIRKLDLREVRIDILACGGQKFLQAGAGIGFMYVNQNIVGDLKHFKPGIRSVNSYSHEEYSLKSKAARFQDGTQNLSGIVALHASIKAINERGIERIERASVAKLNFIKQTLRLHNIPFIDHERQSNIVSLVVPDAGLLVNALRNDRVYLKQIGDIARISFNESSSEKDIAAMIRRVRRELDRS